MAVDMKTMIADAVARLLFEQNKKRITVKDIVDECNITRQAFYYHFADIPELLEWIVGQKAEEIAKKLEEKKTPEEALKYWFLMFLNVKPCLEKSIKSNYGEELKQIIFKQIHDLYFKMAEEKCAIAGNFDKELMVRYHFHATMGLLAEWTEQDTENIDRIVHDICLIADGKIDEL